MARLTETEKRQLTEAAKRRVEKPPPPRPMSPRAYVEFATWAAKFSRGTKPVRFTGENWKL